VIRVRVLALVLVAASTIVGCGPTESLRPFVPSTAYGVDAEMEAFRTFAGSRVTVWVGQILCGPPIGAAAAWLTISVPDDATPGVYYIDTLAPADPAPGTSTATVTVSEPPALTTDQATNGYVQIDEIDATHVRGLADIDFPEGRFGVEFDAPPCTP
jgi:hypothetical protein